MDDYISREAAVAAMTALRQEDIEAFGMVIPECFPSTSAIEALNKIPAADVRPVARGKWLPTRDDNKKECSKCNVIHLIAQYPAGRADWCPNCGADMRGGGEDA